MIDSAQVIKSGRKGHYPNVIIPDFFDLNIGINEFAIQELSVGSNGPDESSPDETVGQWNIDDDLLHSRFLFVSDGDEVAPSNPPDPSSNVQEENAWSDELTPVSLVTTHYQVRQTI